MRQPGVRSFMRLKERSRVDLPQPEGPMMAVILFSWTDQVDVRQGAEFAIIHSQVFDLHLGRSFSMTVAD